MVKKIVLVGGPSSGKTSVLNNIKKTYEEQGFKVFIVPETATELINSGIKCFGENAIDVVDFQELVMRLQLAKEDIIDRAIKMSSNENILVVYDRGALDNMAYVNKAGFDKVLKRLEIKSIMDLMNNYDLVINLVGSKEFYTTENNKARSEDSDGALKLGKETLKSWFGHNKIKIVLPKETMDEKINEVLNIINDFLGKEQVKRQEKFLVDLEKTNINYIFENGKVMEIEQTYLMSDSDIEKRIRKIFFNDEVSYRFSVYKMLDDGKKFIVEDKIIDERLYESLLEFKDSKYNVINKKRYFFDYKGQYFYLDIFNDNKDLGILEINVGIDENVYIPDFVSVIDKVSKDSNYTNKNIAKLEKGLNMVLKND